MSGYNIIDIQRLFRFGVWVLFFMLLVPIAGFDVDIVYTLTFFGLIFFIIYKFSTQINEMFISEQFRLIQLVLQRRVATYWLLKLGNSWSCDRIVLISNVLNELVYYCGVIEAQLGSIDQIVRNNVGFIQYHKLVVANLVGLRSVWTRISYGVNLNPYRLYRPIFIYSNRRTAVHFLMAVGAFNSN